MHARKLGVVDPLLLDGVIDRAGDLFILPVRYAIGLAFSGGGGGRDEWADAVDLGGVITS